MKQYLKIMLAVALVAAGIVAYSSVGTSSVSQVSAASSDYFLKIEGVEGESTDAGHQGEIDVESWSWGETNMGTGGHGGGGGAGKVSMQDFHFTMKTSKASPKLMLAAATGQHIKEAKLTVRKAGSDRLEYMVIKLSDILVTSYQVAGTSDNVPTDQISLNFTKIEFEYKPQNPDGSLDAPVKAGYDLKANKKI